MHDCVLHRIFFLFENIKKFTFFPISDVNIFRMDSHFRSNEYHQF